LAAFSPDLQGIVNSVSLGDQNSALAIAQDDVSRVLAAAIEMLLEFTKLLKACKPIDHALAIRAVHKSVWLLAFREKTELLAGGVGLDDGRRQEGDGGGAIGFGNVRRPHAVVRNNARVLECVHADYSSVANEKFKGVQMSRSSLQRKA
jgi:hypothetical protein